MPAVSEMTSYWIVVEYLDIKCQCSSKIIDVLMVAVSACTTLFLQDENIDDSYCQVCTCCSVCMV